MADNRGEFRVHCITLGRGSMEASFEAPGKFKPWKNFDAWAGCTGGTVLGRIPHDNEVERCDAVIFMVRPATQGIFMFPDRGQDVVKEIRKMRRRGIFVMMAVTNAGPSQVCRDFASPRAYCGLREAAVEADACIAGSDGLVPLFRLMRNDDKVVYVPTPLPFEYPQWNFAPRPDEAPRCGIFVGTRNFLNPARLHVHGVSMAIDLGRRHGVPVTIVNKGDKDGKDFSPILRALGVTPSVVPAEQVGARGPLPDHHVVRLLDGKQKFPAWMGEMRRHRIVLQLDSSGVPGRVAADAVLARLPVVGGNGSVEKTAFPKFPHDSTDTQALYEIMDLLLEDNSYYETVVSDLEYTAMKELSYEAGVRNLYGVYRAFKTL